MKKADFSEEYRKWFIEEWNRCMLMIHPPAVPVVEPEEDDSFWAGRNNKPVVSSGRVFR